MRRNERGFFLLCTYEILVGAMLLVAIGLTRTLTETRANQQSLVLHQAFHAAEAGVDEAVWEFQQSSGDFRSDEGWKPLADPSLCPMGETCVEKDVNLLGATGNVLVLDTAGPTSTIRASGRVSAVRQATQTVEVIFARSNSHGTPAFFARDSINLGSQALIDGYDSREGAYTPAPLLSNHAVVTNSTASGSIVLHSDVLINGDVLVGPGGSPPAVISMGSGARITGTPAAATAAYTPPPVTVPSGSPCGTNVLDVSGTTTMTMSAFQAGCYARIVVEGAATLRLTGDGMIMLHHSLTDLQLKSGATMVFDGNITLVTGELQLDSGAQVQIPLGSPPIKMYVTSAASFGAHSGINNLTQIPKNLALYYTGQDTFEVHAQGAFYGVVYAPDAKVDYGSQAQAFGSVVARVLVLNSQSQFHYDEALTEADSSAAASPGWRMWRQLPP